MRRAANDRRNGDNRIERVIGMARVDKVNYYLDIAQTVAERSTCLRSRFGAIIVKNDEIVSTGYTGAPRGRKNCTNLRFCAEESGEGLACRSVHAEENAIISAARGEMIGAVLYLVGQDARTGEIDETAMPCAHCKRLIINAGIARIVVRRAEGRFAAVDVRDWVFLDDTLPQRMQHVR